MAEIGVQRLAAGHGKKHGSERNQADGAVRKQKLDAVIWVDGRQHRRIITNVDEPEQR